MSRLSAESLYLAGFTLAHAAWSISDAQTDELLCPLAVIEEGDERRLMRFEAETQELAIEKAKDSTHEWQTASSTYAFAREGQWRPGGSEAEPEDVLTVEFWGPGMDAPEVVIQPFRRADRAAPFTVAPRPQLVIGGRILKDEDAGSAIEVLLEGVRSHPEVASLWQTWTGRDPAP